MSCCNKYKKSILDAYSNTSRTYLANTNIIYDNIYKQSGQSINFTAGSSTVNLVKSGVYLVMFSADATASVAGNITVTLSRNGVVVPGATATETAVGTTDVHNLNISTIIEVGDTCCCSGFGVSQIPLIVANSGVGATFTNVKLVVIKLA